MFNNTTLTDGPRSHMVVIVMADIGNNEISSAKSQYLGGIRLEVIDFNLKWNIVEMLREKRIHSNFRNYIHSSKYISMIFAIRICISHPVSASMSQISSKNVMLKLI